MKRNVNILYLLALIGFASLNAAAQQDDAINTKKETPVKIIEYIVGDWQVTGIFKDKKNITNEDTLGMNQRISFDREGRYVRDTGDGTKEEGSYRLNENHAILYLETESQREPSEWNVSFRGDDMILQRRNSYGHAESFRYVYTRQN